MGVFYKVIWDFFLKKNVWLWWSVEFSRLETTPSHETLLFLESAALNVELHDLTVSYNSLQQNR